jgi:hypothetical protein
MTEPQTFLGRPSVEGESGAFGELGPITLMPLTNEIAESVMKGMFELKKNPPNHKMLIAKSVKTKSVIKARKPE